MQHSIQTDEIGNFDVPRVLEGGRHPADFAAGRKRAARVEIAVKTDHFMSRLNQHRRKNGADVAQMPRYQHTHSPSLLFLLCSSYRGTCRLHQLNAKHSPVVLTKRPRMTPY